MPDEIWFHPGEIKFHPLVDFANTTPHSQKVGQKVSIIFSLLSHLSRSPRLKFDRWKNSFFTNGFNIAMLQKCFWDILWCIAQHFLSFKCIVWGVYRFTHCYRNWVSTFCLNASFHVTIPAIATANITFKFIFPSFIINILMLTLQPFKCSTWFSVVNFSHFEKDFVKAFETKNRLQFWNKWFACVRQKVSFSNLHNYQKPINDFLLVLGKGYNFH